MFFPYEETAEFLFTMWLFWTFKSLKKRFLASGEMVSLTFAKWTFIQKFLNIKTFLTHRRIGRVSVSEVTIYGRFRAWGIVFTPPAKRLVYRSRNDSFFRRFGTRKSFYPKDEFAVIRSRSDHLSRSNIITFARFGSWKTFPRHRLNGRVPVREVNIFIRFRAWGNVF